MEQKFNHIIIGAGLAGLSTAYFLLKKGESKICLIEMQKTAGLGASTQNASMLCQIVRDPITCQVMIDSVNLIKREWLKLFPEVQFKECGSLHIGRQDDLKQFDDSLKIAKRNNVEVQVLRKDEVVNKFPLLKETEFEKALWCPSDGIIDIYPLIENLLNHIKSKEVDFIHSKEARIKHDAGLGLYVDTDDGRLVGQKIINARGAWSDEFQSTTPLQTIQVDPTKRHVFVTKKLPFEIDNIPIVWDVTNSIYLRPNKDQSLTLSPCDEEESFATTAVSTSEKAYNELQLKLRSFFPKLIDFPIEKKWAGLRTFSKDKKFIIGEDGFESNFLWVCGLGGYGLTASAKVGDIASSILTGEAKETKSSTFSPKRFIS